MTSNAELNSARERHARRRIAESLQDRFGVISARELAIFREGRRRGYDAGYQAAVYARKRRANGNGEE